VHKKLFFVTKKNLMRHIKIFTMHKWKKWLK